MRHLRDHVRHHLAEVEADGKAEIGRGLCHCAYDLWWRGCGDEGY